METRYRQRGVTISQSPLCDAALAVPFSVSRGFCRRSDSSILVVLKAAIDTNRVRFKSLDIYWRRNETSLQQDIAATKYRCNKISLQQDIAATRHRCNKISLQQDIAATRHRCNMISLQQDIAATRHRCNKRSLISLWEHYTCFPPLLRSASDAFHQHKNPYGKKVQKYVLPLACIDREFVAVILLVWMNRPCMYVANEFMCETRQA